MSCIREFRSFIISQMHSSPEIKKAVSQFFDTLDTDLTVGGYEPSSEMDKAIDNLNQSLINLDPDNSNNNQEDNDSIEIPVRKTAPGSRGYNERDTGESEAF